MQTSYSMTEFVTLVPVDGVEEGVSYLGQGQGEHVIIPSFFTVEQAVAAASDLYQRCASIHLEVEGGVIQVARWCESLTHPHVWHVDMRVIQALDKLASRVLSYSQVVVPASSRDIVVPKSAGTADGCVKWIETLGVEGAFGPAEVFQWSGIATPLIALVVCAGLAPYAHEYHIENLV